MTIPLILTGLAPIAAYGPDMTTKPLTERLRASHTSAIMLEAADALDDAAQKYAALLEDYKELESQLAAVGAGGVSLMGDGNG